MRLRNEGNIDDEILRELECELDFREAGPRTPNCSTIPRRAYISNLGITHEPSF